jgi:type I restriction enzyme S subunit
VLEKADTLRSQCQQMEQELNSLAQTVFLDMFGDPVRNEKNWRTCKLKELVADLQGGKSIAASENEENAGKNRVLKISAVTWGEFRPAESKPLSNSYTPPKEHFVRPNDLLFSRANTTELVGATSLVFSTPTNVLLPDKLWRFLWNDDKAQSQVFMWQLLSNQSVRRELSKISTGSGGSMKNISKAKLYDFEIIYPDKQLQLDFELKFIKIREQLSSNIELQRLLSANFNSLMQKAFKGELKLKDVA